MTSQVLQLNCHINASPEKVFDFFGDHESFGRIWPGKTLRIKNSNHSDDPNDIGSIRQIKLGPTRFEETQLSYTRPSLIEYTVSKGSPIKNHHGRICFSPASDGGTDINYSIAFDPKIPCTGKLIANNLRNNWRKGIQPVIAELEAS